MTLLKEIQEQLKLKSTSEGKLSTQKFVPNSQEIYGTRMPDINELAKQYKEGGFDLVKELWTSGAFEEKVLAAKLLNRICKKIRIRLLNW
jgi:3-methyladenine DNA glycosylase AlkD